MQRYRSILIDILPHQNLFPVMIDRKYNRTTDTGRFELIHKGTPVPVPIYVGMELRVEGKVCKTGRVQNTNTKIIAPVSAPPQISSNKDVPIVLESNEPHSISALGHPSNELVSTHETFIDQTDTVSSDSLADKIDEGPYHFYPAEKNNRQQRKITAKKNNRISVDTLPVRSINRTKVESRLPSSKGNLSIASSSPRPFDEILRSELFTETLHTFSEYQSFVKTETSCA